MSIVIKVKEGTDGLWNVCRDADPVVTRLSLGSAIQTARGLGRATHANTGIAVLVVMICPNGMTLLARYAEPVAGNKTAACFNSMPARSASNWISEGQPNTAS